MRKWLIACTLFAGCVPELAPYVVEEIAEEPVFEEPVIEEPQPLVLSDGTVVPVTSTAWMQPGERIAFTASNEGVVCRRLTVDGWDEVMLVEPGNEPTGIDVSGDGALLVSDEDGIKKLESDWSEVREIMDPIAGTTLGKIDCTASGDIVVAAKTADGSRILVVDQDTGEVLTESVVHEDTAIVDIEVVGDKAYVVEQPTVESAGTCDGCVVVYDLTTDPPAATELATGEELGGEPTAVVVTPDDEIVVSVEPPPPAPGEVAPPDAILVEVDPTTHAIVEQVAIEARAMDGIRDMAYWPGDGGIFYTTDGDAIYEFDRDGNLLAIHSYPMLAGTEALVLAKVTGG